MFGMAIDALLQMFEPARLAFLFLGVFIGLVVGVIPGVGGLIGLSLLLPFTFTMDAYAAIAMMLGLLAVTTTSDTIPAVLFGVPGTVGSAATVLDGYPMAQKGQAGRAMGAAFLASLAGGLIGALFLALSIPIMRPLVLSIGTPELVAICLFGLSLVAVLSAGAMWKGLTAACLGLLIATTGMDLNTGTMRWTFGSLYLFDGMPIVPVALGLFALPELADLFIRRTAISQSGKDSRTAGQLQGVRDVLRNKFLVFRSAIIGAGLGSVPGIGASVIDWIAYGHARRSEKDTDGFGSGDVRGVIASESSNNAKEGGALVPTIAFGVPGSPAMALLLGAFMVHNITPGPEMLGSRLDVTYTMVWSVALANILGAGLCFVLANQFARLAQVRLGILLPLVLSIVYIGVYQASHAWGDFYVLFAFGLLGWIMKRAGWPRPPLILGFVLGALVENYLFISIQRYGFDWLLRPGVIVILTVTAFGILNPVVRSWLKRRKQGPATVILQAPGPRTAFALVAMALFGAALVASSTWPSRAQLVPQIICWGGLIFATIQAVTEIVVVRRPGQTAGPTGSLFDSGGSWGDITTRDVMLRAATYMLWALAFLAAAALVGLLPSILIFMIAYMRLEGRERWRTVLAVSIPAWIGMLFLFQYTLRVHWPISMLGGFFPGLRSQFGIF